MKAALANLAWCASGWPARAAFARALDDPAAAQAAALRDYLALAAGSAFGREHGLAEVRTPADLARRVPPRDYDAFRPYVERIRRGEPEVLTTGPVRRLVPTSGSTAARKLIPYTPAMHRQIDRAVGPWVVDLYRRTPAALLGASYWSVSPLADTAGDREPSAVPIGFEDDAEYLGGLGRWVVGAAMAVPSAVRHVPDVDDWRYVALLMLLRRAGLALVSVWHPSFLRLLLDALPAHWESLVRDVADGTCARPLPSAVRRHAVRPADPERARQIERAGPCAPTRLWPGLRVVSCWADAAAAGPAAALAADLPGVVLQPKGIVATEGVVSIPFAGLHPLAVRSHYLEFEDDAGAVGGAADLTDGREYRVLLTTAGGLCRYRLGDVVRVDGRVGRTPSVRLVGRAGLVSDLAGEKLSDGFVAEVVGRVLGAAGVRAGFAMLAPDRRDTAPAYTLFVDADVPAGLALSVDEALSSNPHYALCRRLGQLAPARVVRVRGDGYSAYVRRRLAQGMRLGDIKAAALDKADGWAAWFGGPAD